MLRHRLLVTLVVAAICVVSFMILWRNTPGHQINGSAPSLYTTSNTASSRYGNAHKFSEADDYWQYFEGVFQLKPVTMEEAKAGCAAWTDLEPINFQFTKSENAFVDTAWVLNDTSERVLDQRRTDWQDFMMHGSIPYGDVSNNLNGRGIVIVGGQSQSYHRIKVLLRQLKRLGSSMAVELHYWDDELDDQKRNELSGLWPHISFNDLSLPHNVYTTQRAGSMLQGNYQLKTAACLNSNFAEILLMDSDNIPTIKPEDLFDSKTYKEFGTVFWPDIARTRVNNPIWSITNTVCQTDEYEQESGQALINKRKFWYHLQLAMFFINHENSLYYNNIILGDKDTFRFAWHALKTEYGRPAHWLAIVGIKMASDHFCGHHFAQFHPDREDGRVAFMHGGLLKTMDKQVMAWHRKANGGIFHAYKTSDKPFDAAELTRTEIKFDGAAYWKDKPEVVEVQMCTDMRDMVATPFEELISGFNEAFEEVGGYWLIDSDFTSGT